MDLFDEQWRARADRGASKGSWARRFLERPNERYASALSGWLATYPLPHDELRRRLESFKTDQHVGAANQLAWWRAMAHLRWTATPIPEAQGASRPDFLVTAPGRFACEVTTVNAPQSPHRMNAWEDDGRRLEKHFESGIDHHNSDTVRRITNSWSEPGKAGQIAWAKAEGLPFVLVVFDYASWDFTQSHLHPVLAKHLLGNERGFERHADAGAVIITSRHNEHWALDATACIRNPRHALLFTPGGPLSAALAPFRVYHEYGEVAPTLRGWVDLTA